jgi:hypothetical protein
MKLLGLKSRTSDHGSTILENPMLFKGYPGYMSRFLANIFLSSEVLEFYLKHFKAQKYNRFIKKSGINKNVFKLE